jgi:hypothetical protein
MHKGLVQETGRLERRVRVLAEVDRCAIYPAWTLENRLTGGRGPVQNSHLLQQVEVTG